MTVEVATTIATLDSALPAATDPKSEGDDHIRLIKTVLKANVVSGPASSTDNTLPRFDGTTGKLLQSSAATLDDAGGFAGVTSINGGQLAGLRNKIINGKMEIAQRGTSFPALAPGYSLDRWRVDSGTTAVVTISQQTDVPSSNEFQASLRATVTTADTSIAAGDLYIIRQRVEGYSARDLIGRTFTISFWVRSSKTGIHCASIQNVSATRTYVSEYTVNAANTWEYKTITVSGGLITAGTWDWTTGTGVSLDFSLACGSTYQTTAGAWQTGNFIATANQVNCLDTIGNIFAITGVQLEVGSVATPFEHRPYGMELALCQRYYYRVFPGVVNRQLGNGWVTLSTQGVCETPFPVPMRTPPTALEQSGTANQYTVAHANMGTVLSAVPAISFCTTYSAITVCTVASGLTAGQAFQLRTDGTNGASAYLGWSAEL